MCFYSEYRQSVILCLALEPSLIHAAYRAALGRGLGIDGETAAAAHPFGRFVLLELRTAFETLQEFEIPCLVHLLHLGDELVEVGNMREALLGGNLGEVLIKVAPFLALSAGGLGKVHTGVAHNPGRIAGGDFHGAAFQQREELARMTQFLLGGFEKDGGNLLIAFVLGLVCNK